jgi:hypothetical protein
MRCFTLRKRDTARTICFTIVVQIAHRLLGASRTAPRENGVQPVERPKLFQFIDLGSQLVWQFLSQAICDRDYAWHKIITLLWRHI